ncbi:conserved hypothetical protein [Perkinsus marinus ATCC 50983]|uniref:DUF1445 domain-containing protein n=1 Tax=Perkinsus marinus (strain ATCC 50983 / TXsc) TaxID=423536 RepID=C5KDN0_PERM5|nr:conserved hypothetical protein [Perkinsus marinus ATCC 50983]EER17334.1 conserved hypothetical protein [Perkinsus marinus ATCC 50983]|eukprot:XP_002785538.1 conserved hypothetical protein [Perkinsus marinus ATCC 50983]
MPPEQTWQFKTGYDGAIGNAIFDEKTAKWEYSNDNEFTLDENKALERTRDAIQEIKLRFESGSVDATTAIKFREKCRNGLWSGPTSGKALGHANLVILPSKHKDDFERFCALNFQSCPLLEMVESTFTIDGDGNRQLRLISKIVAPGADLLTDASKYTVYDNSGKVEVLRADRSVPKNVEALTGFVFGCSFSWEDKLAEAGVPPRHMVQGKNVSMYRTNIPNKTAGPFGGNLVVSMRPYRLEQVPLVIDITSRFPLAHGRPMHVGDGSAIGVDVTKPSHYGDTIEVNDNEVCVFWCCGVTSTVGALSASLEFLITHSPGHMLVLDITNDMLIDIGDT